jgi:hypothetical protein
MEPEGSLLNHKYLPRIPIFIQSNPNGAAPFHFLNIQFNVVIPSYASVEQAVSFQLISPPKPNMHLSCTSHVPHILPIKLFSDHPNNI